MAYSRVLMGESMNFKLFKRADLLWYLFFTEPCNISLYKEIILNYILPFLLIIFKVYHILLKLYLKAFRQTFNFFPFLSAALIICKTLRKSLFPLDTNRFETLIHLSISWKQEIYILPFKLTMEIKNNHNKS